MLRRINWFLYFFHGLLNYSIRKTMNQQTTTEHIYPNRQKAYEVELKRLKTWKISQHNKDLIVRFHNYLSSTGSGHLRITKLSSQLRKCCNSLGNFVSSLSSSFVIFCMVLSTMFLHRRSVVVTVVVLRCCGVRARLLGLWGMLFRCCFWVCGFWVSAWVFVCVWSGI